LEYAKKLWVPCYDIVLDHGTSDSEIADNIVQESIQLKYGAEAQSVHAF
jgi:hypothetical protein